MRIFNKCMLTQSTSCCNAPGAERHYIIVALAGSGAWGKNTEAAMCSRLVALYIMITWRRTYAVHTEKGEKCLGGPTAYICPGARQWVNVCLIILMILSSGPTYSTHTHIQIVNNNQTVVEQHCIWVMSQVWCVVGRATGFAEWELMVMRSGKFHMKVLFLGGKRDMWVGILVINGKYIKIKWW